MREKVLHLSSHTGLMCTIACDLRGKVFTHKESLSMCNDSHKYIIGMQRVLLSTQSRSKKSFQINERTSTHRSSNSQI